MNRVYRQTYPCSWIVLAAVALADFGQSAMSQATPPRPAGAPANQQAAHPLDPAIEMARVSLRHIQANIQDYTAVLIKRLRIDGEMRDHQFAFVKIRNRKRKNGRVMIPMGVYMRFLKPDSVKGREVIWVEGKNDGKLIVHEAGLKNLLRVSLDPAGFIAMRGQRYPITEIGLENLVRKVVETGQRDRRHQKCQVRFFKNARVGESVCTVMEVVHPVERPYFDFHVARVYFDDELKVPIHYASWSWPTEKVGQPVLEEEYTYTNVTLNVGLTDRDFDPDNPEYNFP